MSDKDQDRNDDEPRNEEERKEFQELEEALDREARELHEISEINEAYDAASHATSEAIRKISAHIAAERRKRRAHIFYNWLDVLDRGGVTIGAISTIAVFFPVLPDGSAQDAMQAATQAGDQITIVVRQAAQIGRDTTLASFGMVTGFVIAAVSSYVKALLTWRDK